MKAINLPLTMDLAALYTFSDLVFSFSFSFFFLFLSSSQLCIIKIFFFEFMLLSTYSQQSKLSLLIIIRAPVVMLDYYNVL